MLSPIIGLTVIASAISAAPGRTITLVVAEDVGAPLERAFPSATYARAAAADAELRWQDARALYSQAADDWRARETARPSRALESAIAKAMHEAALSEALRNRVQRGTPALDHLDPEAQHVYARRQALEDGLLLRAKLMSTRAVLGRLPPELYTRARSRLEAARSTGGESDAQVELQLCALYAVGRQTAAARLARDHVTSAERVAPRNTLALAACDAALGDTGAALAKLEAFVLRPLLPHPADVLRDVYLANDWDHLRGRPRFESLFR